EEMAARKTLNTVFAIGERRLQAEEVEHLRHGQRDHGKIDALAADSDHADDDTEEEGCSNAGKNGQFGCELPDFHGVRRDIGSAAEERGMPEGKQARVAEQQIEGRREQDEAEQL